MKFILPMFVCSLFSLKICHTWSGILMDDSLSNGGTQLYFPLTLPQYVGNVTTFGLQHFGQSRAVFLNGKAYFIGGNGQSSGNISASVFVFDPVTNTTARGPSLNVGRENHAVTVVGSTIVTCGGYNINQSPKYISTCEQLINNTWTQLPDLMYEVNGGIALAALNNIVYVFGGINYVHLRITNFVYMLNGAQWVQRTAIPEAVAFHSAIALDSNRALICGGVNSVKPNTTPTNACYIYSASADTWTLAPSMEMNRRGHAMVSLGGRLFILGGSGGKNTTPWDTVEVYSTIYGGQILPYRMATADTQMATVAIN